MSILVLLSIYLIYRLATGDEYSRLDYILLIIFLAGGLANSLRIFYKRKKEKKE
jgi:hypothetical protein